MGKPITVQRESQQLIACDVTLNGSGITDFNTSVVASGTRPTVWVPAVTVGSDTGAMVSGLSEGLYEVFVQVVGDSETVVLQAGTLVVE